MFHIEPDAPFYIAANLGKCNGTARQCSPTKFPVHKVGYDRDGYGIYVRGAQNKVLYWVQPCFLKEEKS